MIGEAEAAGCRRRYWRLSALRALDAFDFFAPPIATPRSSWEVAALSCNKHALLHPAYTAR